MKPLPTLATLILLGVIAYYAVSEVGRRRAAAQREAELAQEAERVAEEQRLAATTATARQHSPSSPTPKPGAWMWDGQRNKTLDPPKPPVTPNHK